MIAEAVRSRQCGTVTRLGILPLAFAIGAAPPAYSMCVPREAHSASEWSRILLHRAAAVVEAEVERAEDPVTRTPAILRATKVYMGSRSGRFIMAWPGYSATDVYSGVMLPVGANFFVVLYGKPGAYTFEPCTQYVLTDLEYRAALIRRAVGHR
jgi:hypothetical protein